MFAYGTAFNYNLQTSANGVNESALKDMDFVLNEAAKRNLKLTVALSSNWVYGPNTTGTRYIIMPSAGYVRNTVL